MRVDCLAASSLQSGVWSEDDVSLWRVDNEAGTFIARVGDQEVRFGGCCRLTPPPCVAQVDSAAPQQLAPGPAREAEPFARSLFDPDSSPSVQQQRAWAERAQSHIQPARLAKRPGPPSSDAMFWLLELLTAEGEHGWVWRARAGQA